MAFTRALYYPWIDINNEEWLKNAMFYWEQIYTIVPASIRYPYNTRTTDALFDQGLLVPLRVEPGMEEIQGLAKTIRKYLDSKEGLDFLLVKDSEEFSTLSPSKLPEEITRMVHEDKFPFSRAFNFRRDRDNNEWILVNSKFADFYMTILANRLSERFGLGLLTDTPVNDSLAGAVKRDSKLCRMRPYYHSFRAPQDALNVYSRNITQGMLVNLIIEGINIDPCTSIDDIINFKNQHANELGLFRTNIENLTRGINLDQPIEGVRREVEDIYINQVLPSIENLKRALKYSGIKYATETFLKVAFYSTGTAALLPSFLGMDVSQAVYAGAGMSFLASSILYNVQKAQLLQENPYSYLVAMKNRFQR